MLSVEVVNRQSLVPIDADRLADAARRVLLGQRLRAGQVTIAVVDAAAIQALNRRHLGHDYATDVLSFLLEREGDGLEGDIVVSAQCAAAQAGRYGWPAGDELLLYVVHGALHLAGHDDQQPAARRAIQRLEDRYLGELGLVVPRDEDPHHPDRDPGPSRRREARTREATP